ncbi:hypothetical protein OROMI_029781 [Orobanche minor]
MRSCSLILLDLLPLSKPLALIRKDVLDWNEMLIERYIAREFRIISENTSYDFAGDLMGITDTVLQQDLLY